MKWTKQTYQIDIGGEKKDVTGSVCGQWGIDKRENQYYVLTHIPTGCRVESTKTMTALKELAEMPAFTDFTGDPVSLAKAISEFRSKYGWTK